MHGSGGLVAAQVQVWWSFKLVVYGQDWWSLSGLCASLVVIQFVFKFGGHSVQQQTQEPPQEVLVVAMSCQVLVVIWFGQ